MLIKQLFGKRAMIIKTIDLRDKTALPIDDFTNGFEVRWDNTLLVTSYSRQQTLVVTRHGELIVMDRSLKRVLDDFSDFAGIHYFEMRCLYQLTGERTFGYVAGNYSLIPTCGRTNPAVAYFMKHHLDNFCLDEETENVLATFKGKKGSLIRVMLDTNLRTFKRMWSATHTVGRIHLLSLENQCRHYGVKKGELARMVNNDRHHPGQHHRDHHESMIFQIMTKIITATAIDIYGENLSTDFYETLLNRYHQSNC